MKKTLLSLTSVIIAGFSLAQMSIPALNSAVIENFNDFNGSGITSSPTTGQLDSDTWRITGMSSESAAVFGGDYVAGDFARGGSNGSVGTGGVYAFYDGTDSIFGIHPGGSDWTPGDLTLKVQNNTGSVITSLEISYNVWILNDQARANSFNFAHSADDLTYTDETTLDLVSVETADGAPVWVETNRSITISSLNIADGAFYYLQWKGDDETGGGSRDEFGLDDVSITAQNVVVPCTTPVVDDLADGTYCMDYTLPTITGTDLSADVAYFTEINGGGTEYAAGAEISSTQTLYLYDSTGVGCVSEEEVLITINTAPNAGMDSTFTICENSTIDLDDYLVGNTSSDMWAETTASGTFNTLTGEFVAPAGNAQYSFTHTANGVAPCINDEAIFTVNVTSSPVIDAQLDVTVCDTYTLAAITGTNLSGNLVYSSEEDGLGTEYTVGESIEATQMIYIYDSIGAGCTSQESYTVTVNMTPSFDLLGAYTDCDSVLVPSITGTNLTANAGLFTEMNAGGTQIFAGDYIYASTTLYAFDETETTPNCIVDQFVIFQIDESLFAGDDHDTTIANNVVLDLSGVIDEDNGGIIVETTMPVSGQLDNVNFEFDANGLADGIYTFEYITDGCVDDTAVITVTVEDPTNSISENESISFDFYPNPASSELNVVGVDFNGYSIIDLTGKSVQSNIANNSLINVASLTEGTYILELRLENNQIARKRFVKK